MSLSLNDGGRYQIVTEWFSGGSISVGEEGTPALSLISEPFGDNEKVCFFDLGFVNKIN
jgi:hypothetical protein